MWKNSLPSQVIQIISAVIDIGDRVVSVKVADLPGALGDLVDYLTDDDGGVDWWKYYEDRVLSDFNGSVSWRVVKDGVVIDNVMLVLSPSPDQGKPLLNLALSDRELGLIDDDLIRPQVDMKALNNTLALEQVVRKQMGVQILRRQ